MSKGSAIQSRSRSGELVDSSKPPRRTPRCANAKPALKHRKAKGQEIFYVYVMPTILADLVPDLNDLPAAHNLLWCSGLIASFDLYCCGALAILSTVFLAAQARRFLCVASFCTLVAV